MECGASGAALVTPSHGKNCPSFSYNHHMPNPIQRFTSRVDTYVKYRPSYPTAVIDLLRAECGLTNDAVVADVGSGTGIFTELLLKNGNEVFAVEPNEAMRTAAEQLLQSYSRFKSIGGSAEATTLSPVSVDLVTACQAFHWFDRERARAEFVRILKPNAFVALIWNDRRLDSTPFLQGFESLLLTYGTDYAQVRSANVVGEIPGFFAAGRFQMRSFFNSQEFDFEGLKGRVSSSSYTPAEGNPKFVPMLAELRTLFDIHQQNGKVAFEYDTQVFYGTLS